MRRTHSTTDASSFATHDHVVWCGRGTPDLHVLAAEAFTAALPRGEQLVFVAQDPDLGLLHDLGDLEDLMRRDVLHVVVTADAYDVHATPAELRVAFEARLDDALAEGFTGLCVVADNTESAVGSDEAFATWLAWEAEADRMQAQRPINGVCYFDATVVAEERLRDIATLHSVSHAELGTHDFRLVADCGGVRVLGEVDASNHESFGRIVDAAAVLTTGTVDLGDADFVDHRALMALERSAQRCGPVQVRGAQPVLQQVWRTVNSGDSALEFC